MLFLRHLSANVALADVAPHDKLCAATMSSGLVPWCSGRVRRETFWVSFYIAPASDPCVSGRSSAIHSDMDPSYTATSLIPATSAAAALRVAAMPPPQ